MVDRTKLREAIARWESWGPMSWKRETEPLAEAARLVADPNTLVISKVDGEWPARLLAVIAYDNYMLAEHQVKRSEIARAVLDDLLEESRLAHQVGSGTQ